MAMKTFIEKLIGKDKDKLMAIDFDSNGFSIWLNEPYIFVINEAGCLGFDYGDFETMAKLNETLKFELSMGILTKDEYHKRNDELREKSLGIKNITWEVK